MPDERNMVDATIDGVTLDNSTLDTSTLDTSTLDTDSLFDALPAEVEAASSGFPSRYRDLGPIGKGGMGEVRRVVDRRLGGVMAMKILHPRLVGSPAARARFLAEARLTARLRHPGIVAVQDQGTLPDGRPWFTMTEVVGRELKVPLRAGASRRRLVELLMRSCQAMAYAHSQGVIHRDLKPSNIMVGDFGEVLVMDWGLGRALGGLVDEAAGEVLLPEEQTLNTHATRYGQVMGTPAYMPPEQAVGMHDQLTATVDVYALGAILYEILAGRAPYPYAAEEAIERLLAGPPPPVNAVARQPVPPGLQTICNRAMLTEPSARYPSAAEMAEALSAWLDGDQRRGEALSLVEQARQQRPDILRRSARARALRKQAREMLGTLDSWEPPERKRLAWNLEDEAAGLEAEAAVLEARWLQTLRGSLNLVDDLPEAHDELADHYRARLLAAERSRHPSDVARYTTLLKAHDRGRHASFLKGMGAVSLVTDPPGAEVECLRYEQDGRRMVPVSQGILGRTPLREVPLKQGSYLLMVRREGCEPVRYPVLIEREGHWDGIAPGDAESFPIKLPPAGSLHDDECYVPAGWFWSGGDAQAIESLPSRRLWVGAMVVERFPVTHIRYLDFINDLVRRGEEVLAFVPRLSGQADAQMMYAQESDGRFSLLEDDKKRCGPQLPVTAISWHAAQAFAAWAHQRTGQSWRLPNELEWEKAARGVDARCCAWGDLPEPGWARTIGSLAESPAPAEVTDYPVDVSVYGVRGMTGNVREWCINTWKARGPSLDGERVLLDAATADEPELRALRGGAWSSAGEHSRLAGRTVNLPDRWFAALGFRLFRFSR